MKQLLTLALLMFWFSSSYASCVDKSLSDEVNYKNCMAEAIKGNASAQHNIALMYLKGIGVSKNDRQAFIWYEKSAVQGVASAQYNLGLMYELGKGVERNNVAASSWYEKSADQGDGNALLNLGILYYQGQGVSPDIVMAYKLFTLSSMRGNQDATYNTYILAKEMTTSQIVEAQRQASEWLAEHQ